MNTHINQKYTINNPLCSILEILFENTNISLDYRLISQIDKNTQTLVKSLFLDVQWFVSIYGDVPSGGIEILQKQLVEYNRVLDSKCCFTPCEYIPFTIIHIDRLGPIALTDNKQSAKELLYWFQFDMKNAPFAAVSARPITVFHSSILDTIKPQREQHLTRDKSSTCHF